MRLNALRLEESPKGSSFRATRRALEKKTLRRINALVKDIDRNGPVKGIGDPEVLKGNLQGFFSRRINEKDRLVYRIENGQLLIAQCRNHYDE